MRGRLRPQLRGTMSLVRRKLLLLALMCGTVDSSLYIPNSLVGMWNATRSVYRAPTESKEYANRFETCIVETPQEQLVNNEKANRKTIVFRSNETSKNSGSMPIVVSAFDCPIQFTDVPVDPRDVVFSTQTRGLLSVAVYSDNFYEGVSMNEWHSSGCFCSFFYKSTNENFNGLVKLAESVLGKKKPLRFCTTFERTGKLLRMKTEVNKIWIDVEARCPTSVGQYDDQEFDEGAMIYIEELEEHSITDEERKILDSRLKQVDDAGRGNVDTLFMALLVSSLALVALLYAGILHSIGRKMGKYNADIMATLEEEVRTDRESDLANVVLESHVDPAGDDAKTPDLSAITSEIRRQRERNHRWRSILILTSVQMFAFGLCFTSFSPVIYQSKCVRTSGKRAYGCNIFGSNIHEAMAFVSYLTALSRAVRFFTRPFYGKLSDTFGRRPIILMSFAANFCTIITLVVSPTRTGLLLSFLCSAFLDSNTTALFAIVTDIGQVQIRLSRRHSNENEATLVESVANTRARLWTTLLTFLVIGAGFGLISNILFNVMIRLALPNANTCQLPLIFSSIVMAINFLLAFFFFPETLEAQKKNQTHSTSSSKRESESEQTNNFHLDCCSRMQILNCKDTYGKSLIPIFELLKNRKIRKYALVLMVWYLASSSSFLLPWWTDLRFHWTELDIALYGCYVVAIVLIVYGFLGPFLFSKFQSKTVIKYILPIGIVGPIAMGLSWQPWMWYLISILTSPATLAEPMLLAIMSSKADFMAQGQFSGAVNALKGFIRIFSPFLLMIIFSASVRNYDCYDDGLKFRPNTGAVFYLQSAMTAAGYLYFYWSVRKDEGAIISKKNKAELKQSNLIFDVEGLVLEPGTEIEI